MSHYVVTGGAGFIGSAITRRLLAEGAGRVVVIDNLLSGRESNLEEIRARIDFQRADIRNYEEIAPIIRGAAVVFHEAAIPSVPRSIEDPVPSHDVNANGTFNVLRAAKEGQAGRVVYAASSSAYGDTEVLPKVENMTPRPKSPYALQKLLDDTVASYQRSLQLTQNQYAQGVAARSDVIQAQTQLQSAQAAAIDNGVARAQNEHAIAVLVGEPASTFSLPPAPLDAVPPGVPAQLPSALLERRPDIASAERKAAAANEQIGIAIAAFFPTLTLSASGGFESSVFSQLLQMPSRFWTLGPSLAGTIFDAGLRKAQTEAARAAYDQQVATYRQTVLAAFQDVEDNLASQRILGQEIVVQQQAVDSAQHALAIVTNEYKAGTTDFQNVLSAQATAFTAQQKLVSIGGQRMVSSVGLVKALGGGWDASQVDRETGSVTAPAVASAASAPAVSNG